MMQKTVLLYNVQDKNRLLKIRQALLPLGIRIRLVNKEDYGKPVGLLAGIKGIDAAEQESDLKDDFNDEMAVMAGFTSAQVDAFIRALYKRGVGRIDYKAILTPYNVLWSSVKLYREIKKEHEAMTGQSRMEGEYAGESGSEKDSGQRDIQAGE